MHIVEQTKFLCGVVFAMTALVIFIATRPTRGFGQRNQAVALLLIVAVIFMAKGLGYDPRALIGL